MNEQKLKECPFCGGKASIIIPEDTKRFRPQCISCGASLGEFHIRSSAVDRWNSRPESGSVGSVPSATDLLGVFYMGLNDIDRTAMLHGWDHAVKEGIDAIHTLLSTDHRGGEEQKECQCWDCYKARYAEAKNTPLQPKEVSREVVDGRQLHNIMMEETAVDFGMIEWEDLTAEVREHLGRVAARIIELPPTPWAYEQVCRANEEKRVEIERLKHLSSAPGVAEAVGRINHYLHRIPNTKDGHQIGMVEVGFGSDGQVNYGPFWLDSVQTSAILDRALESDGGQE